MNKSSDNKKMEYDPSSIESKWQKIWEENKTFSPDLKNAKKPFYNLMMFPYPSAEGLHVGNMYAFTGADVYGRYQRMRGNDVFEPIGLDGFGIHSENFALKVGRHPREQAKISQKNFYRQLRATGNAYDWTRTVETYDPDYYRWTQWIFVQMFKKGLAYRKKAQVNWCPTDKTVLADEQVIDGKCERDGSIVEKRDLEQWFFKITDYADRLLNGLTQIDWPEKIKIAQRQWIGKSQGTRVKFIIQKAYKYIILHGHKGSPETDFHPWLKSQLEKLGSEVSIPYLPGGLKPNIEEQVRFLLENYNFDENTVLVTHSLGGVAALKLLPRLKRKVRKLVMVAPSIRTGEFLDGKSRGELQRATDWEFDYEAVREHAQEIIVIADTKDDVVPEDHPRQIARNLRAKIVEVEAPAPHFNSDKAPQVLDEVLDGIEVFTTRADTLFGATFLVLAPEHPVVASLLNNELGIKNNELEQVRKYIKLAKKKTEAERIAEGKEKTGVFSGLYVINPVNQEKIPVWIADYVLMGYGTGAIMAVPAHDSRDFEFAKKYDLPIRQVIVPDEEFGKPQKTLKEAYDGPGGLVSSGDWDDYAVPEAMPKILDYIEQRGIGKREVTYHLRDWLISRQRYWGPPIPMVFCSSCERNSRGEREDMPGWWTVPEDQLPVLLPDVEDWRPYASTSSAQEVKGPLANHPEFYNVACPNCGSAAKRETDVSDTFLDSAWYYLRYLTVGNKILNIKNKKEGEFDTENVAYDIEIVKKWCPVAIYIGGAEHSVLHLLYVRFVAMALHDLESELRLPFEEPFPRFFAHGLLIREHAKMSKSRGNIVVPDEYISKYGADALRMYLMFIGPFEHGGDLRDTGLEGMARFIRRVWKLFITKEYTKDEEDTVRMINKTIKDVSHDIEDFSYNTAIARLMEFYNVISQDKSWSKETATAYLKLFVPFAPHFSEELWEKVSRVSKVSEVSKGIHFEKWPTYDEKYLVEDQVTVVVQVNGKRRGEVTIDSSNINKKDKIETLARKEIKKYVEGETVKNVVYVQGKIINFVV